MQRLPVWDRIQLRFVFFRNISPTGFSILSIIRTAGSRIVKLLTIRSLTETVHIELPPRSIVAEYQIVSIETKFTCPKPGVCYYFFFSPALQGARCFQCPDAEDSYQRVSFFKKDEPISSFMVSSRVLYLPDSGSNAIIIFIFSRKCSQCNLVSRCRPHRLLKIENCRAKDYC